MENIAPILGALTTLLVAIGGAFAWIWNKLEKRFTQIESDLDECKAQHSVDVERRGIMLTVIELLWAHVASVSPEHGVLKRSEKLLDQIKAMDAQARAKDV